MRTTDAAPRRGSRGATLAAALLLLAPSAWFAWQNRDMPAFGYPHDDGLYFVAAKSIAASGSYRIESLPGAPWQTKYPPLLPAWHALGWLVEPSYPANLRVATWLQWVWLPAFGAVVWRLLAQWGFGRGWRFAALALLAVGPYPTMFGTAILSEIPYGTLAGASLLLLERRRVGAAALAAALAFLARTSGIALLLTIPLVLLARRQRSDAARFAAATLPVAAGWFAWSAAHRPAGSLDDATLYYLDYLGFHLRVFDLSHAHLFLAKNVEFLLVSAGSYLLPVLSEGVAARLTTQALGAAVIAGAVRLVATRASARPFGVFAAVTAAMLLAWSFPPNERLLLPLLPILVAGFIVVLSAVLEFARATLRGGAPARRVAAAVAGLAAAALGVLGVATQLRVRWEMMPALMERERARARDAEDLYAWVREHLPPDATCLVAYDVPFYLATGRRAAHQIVDPALWYRGESDGSAPDPAAYARAHRLRHVVWTPFDRRLDVSLERQVETGRALARSPGVRVVHSLRNAVIFEVSPAAGGSTIEAARP